MTVRLAGLTGATLEHAPSVCHSCVWWQSRSTGRVPDKSRWIEKAESDFGAWGSVYYDDDGRVLEGRAGEAREADGHAAATESTTTSTERGRAPAMRSR